MQNLSELRLCFLAGTLGQGGTERQLFYMLETLQRGGAQLQVLCLTKNEFWENEIQSRGVPVIWIGQDRSQLKRLLRIVSALRKNPPMILQSQHFFCNGYAAAAARLLGVREIGAMRADGMNEVRDCGPVGGWLNLHAPRTLAANSRVAIRYARSRRIPAGRLYFVPNVIDINHFTGNGDSSPSHRNDKKALRLILAGRLAEEKRVDRFLDVLARIRNHPALAGREVSATVVGAGPLKEELEEQARRLALWPKAVEFCGTVVDMAPLYHEAAVCVLTSDYEGTPNVLLEAMAAGLPVVATNVGGVADVVQHGQTGFLCDPADTAGMVEALVRLIQDCRLRAEMGAAARRFVTANHALALLPGFLQGLYQKSMNGVINHRLDGQASAHPAIITGVR